MVQLPPRIQARAVNFPVIHYCLALREILVDIHLSPELVENKTKHQVSASKSSLPSQISSLQVLGSELNGGLSKKKNVCITLLHVWRKQIKRGNKALYDRTLTGSSGCAVCKTRSDCQIVENHIWIITV